MIEQPLAELRVDRIVDRVFSIIYCLLGVRLMLVLIAASSETGFARMIAAVTDPLFAVFSGILPEPVSDGRYPLALPVLLAILLYAVVHGLIRTMLRKLAGHRAYS